MDNLNIDNLKGQAEEAQKKQMLHIVLYKVPEYRPNRNYWLDKIWLERN